MCLPGLCNSAVRQSAEHDISHRKLRMARVTVPLWHPTTRTLFVAPRFQDDTGQPRRWSKVSSLSWKLLDTRRARSPLSFECPSRHSSWENQTNILSSRRGRPRLVVIECLWSIYRVSSATYISTLISMGINRTHGSAGSQRENPTVLLII